MNYKTSALKNIFSKFFLNTGNKLKFILINKDKMISSIMFSLFLIVVILNLDFLLLFALSVGINLLFLLLVNLNSALLVELFMLKNGRKVYMLSFLMLNIFTLLFLFLLALSEISFLNITLNFAL